MQESVNHLLVDHVVGSLDPQYLKAHNKDYLGFTGEKTKTLIEYTMTAWCRVSTHHKMKARSTCRELWDQVFHVAACIRRLDTQQA